MDGWLTLLRTEVNGVVEESSVVGFQFDALAPTWVLLVAAVAVYAFVGWRYHREQASRAVRLGLAGCRLAVMSWVVFLISQPGLLVEVSREQSPAATLLVDTSASMAVRDASTSASRFESFAEAWSLAVTSEDDVEWDHVTFDVQGSRWTSWGDVLGRSPDGRQTNLGDVLRAELSSGMRSSTARQLVVISDGKGTVDWSLDAIVGLAKRAGVVIHCVPVGMQADTPLIAIESVWSPRRAFSHDRVLVVVQLGSGPLAAATPMTVEVFDVHSGDVVGSERITVEATSAKSLSIDLGALSPRRHEFAARVLSDVLDESSPVVSEHFAIQIVDQRLRVLYVEDLPRFEYRYLKNLMVREPTLTASCLLLSADVDFVQEGAEAIRRFPQSREEFDRFDVVVLGDVDPHGTWWDYAAQDLLDQQVREAGMGFIVLAGSRWTEQMGRHRALSRLLPVDWEFSAIGERSHSDLPVPLELTLSGAGAPVFALASASSELSSRLPEVYWWARGVVAKPGSQVLMSASEMPVVVAGRYGAGRTLFHGTDDLWRWRREAGGVHHEAYWLNALRFVARDRLLTDDEPVVLATDRERYGVRELVEITATVHGSDKALHCDSPMAVRIETADGGHVARVSLASKNNRLHRGVWSAGSAGAYRCVLEPCGAHLVHATLDDATVAFAVDDSSIEYRDVTPDHRVLEELALRTGGGVFGVGELAALKARVEARQDRQTEVVHARIWDSPSALMVFVFLLCVEWVGRKRVGLV